MNGNERPVLRAIRGPITLITIGVLFAFNNFTAYRFDQTWPVILIVFGLFSLLGRSVDRWQAPPRNQQSWYPPPPPPGNPPQGASYSQSNYAQPAPGAAKGGFGTTAAPRSGDSGEPSGGKV
jgi:hypothetical protein